MEELQITWDTILRIGAGLIILFEFGKWLVSFGDPIVELKRRLDTHDKMLTNDKAHLEKIDKGVDQIDEGIGVLGMAISEMMKHQITGNDIEALKEQQRKVDNYFFNRRKTDEN